MHFKAAVWYAESAAHLDYLSHCQGTLARETTVGEVNRDDVGLPLNGMAQQLTAPVPDRTAAH
jgi:hypothetical protein